MAEEQWSIVNFSTWPVVDKDTGVYKCQECISFYAPGCKGAAAILDTILNYTFLPHISNVYPSFLTNRQTRDDSISSHDNNLQKDISELGPLQGSKVKLRGHMTAYRTPLSPRTKR